MDIVRPTTEQLELTDDTFRLRQSIGGQTVNLSLPDITDRCHGLKPACTVPESACPRLFPTSEQAKLMLGSACVHANQQLRLQK